MRKDFSVYEREILGFFQWLKQGISQCGFDRRGDMGACVEREVLDRVVLFQHQRGFHAGRYCLR